MTIDGETIGTGASPICEGDEPFKHAPHGLELQVLQSGAGFYIGTLCPWCGPYSRESGYYATYEEATAALYAWSFERR